MGTNAWFYLTSVHVIKLWIKTSVENQKLTVLAPVTSDCLHNHKANSKWGEKFEKMDFSLS